MYSLKVDGYLKKKKKKHIYIETYNEATINTQTAEFWNFKLSEHSFLARVQRAPTPTESEFSLGNPSGPLRSIATHSATSEPKQGVKRDTPDTMVSDTQTLVPTSPPWPGVLGRSAVL